MSVVGLNVGNLNSYIGIARQGGIEVITNDYSLHAIVSGVSVHSNNRNLGVDVRQQVNTNIKNTIFNFKHLVGRKFSDPIAQQYIPFVPCQVVRLPNDDIGFKVSYFDQQQVFTPEQVLAALLTKLKQTVEANVEKITKVYDVVLGIPGYFTDVQRKAVLAAVQTAQLNPLRVINESTAIALAYGIKQDLPADTEKPRHVMFLDVGHSCTQASIVAFHTSKFKMIGSSFDLSVGGIWLDDLIREHFRKEMQEKYKIDPKTNPRAWFRLLDESERVKKQMSANRTTIPLNMECFMEDKDVSIELQRVVFEALAAPLFDRVRKLIRNLLQESGMNVQDIESVEIVGGSSRIPTVRQIVQEIFGYEPKTTMNQDEAVATGAAMQCAILSHAFRADVSAVRDVFPFLKLLTFYRNEPFELDAGAGDALLNTVPHTPRQIESSPSSDRMPLDRGLRDLSARLSAALHHCSTTTRHVKSDDMIQSPECLPDFWINKWVNYTDKYGMGYELCDKSVGVLFEDKSTLISDTAGEQLQYKAEDKNVEFFKKGEQPEELERKVTLFSYFQKYMKEGGLVEAALNPVPESGCELDVPRIRTWFPTKSSIVFHLTNGTVQINFLLKHTKLILSWFEGDVTVTNISKEKEVRTFKLSSLKNNGMSASMKSLLEVAESKVKVLLGMGTKESKKMEKNCVAEKTTPQQSHEATNQM